MHQSTEVAIVGAGPAGAATALFLADRGIGATLVERTEFPRFHIGESLTGEAGKLLRDAGLGPEMESRSYPVKHGVQVYGPRAGSQFYVPVVQALPDGSRRPGTTWQVMRSDFDSMMCEQARQRGATVIGGEAQHVIFGPDGWVSGLALVDPNGNESTIDADVVVDASGQGCFLARAGLTSAKSRGRYSHQIAVFAHFSNCCLSDTATPHDTVIFYRESDHWSWFIPVDDDVVSIGVVVPSSYFRAKGESADDFLLRELRDLHPELEWRAAPARAVCDARIIANYSYSIEEYVGPGWLCVGDSHQFVDPVFSFGLHLALHEARRAAEAIEELLLAPDRELEPLLRYQAWADEGQAIIRDLVDSFWAEPFAFAYLAHGKYPDDLIDLFAGRVYDMAEPTPGLRSLRAIANSCRETVGAS